MPLSLLLHSEDHGGGGGKRNAKDRQGSQDSSSVLSPATSSDASSHEQSSWFRRGSAASNNMEDGASHSPANASADTHNPMFPAVGSSEAQQAAEGQSRDGLGRKQPAALPSYLKIPTLIPSTYASPTSSASPSPPIVDETNAFERELDAGQPGSSSTATTPQGGPRMRLGSKAAEAILSTQEVVLAPGEAGKVSSSPLLEEADSSQDTAHAPPHVASRTSNSSNEGEFAERTGTSRTSTPTPGDWKDGRMMTPTENRPNAMSAIYAQSQSGSEKSHDQTRRPSLNLYTGTESGFNTPALPIGLRSAPSSALTPAIPTYGAEGQSTPYTPLTKATNDLSLTHPQTTPTAQTVAGSRQPSSTSGESRPSATPSGRHPASRHVHLVPIQVVWRGGGKEVFVTGTFANEWRSKILLRKSPNSSGRRQEYLCVLHLAPGTHRLKFIVDDRWRVSRDLPTASDGEGNLTNYIEVAHTGPAHPGPLSAPGEDLLAAPEEDDGTAPRAKKAGLTGHRATGDLIEEARRAEVLQRGNLLDVFGDDNVQKEERWTQEIPPSIIKAQAAEEAQRNEEESHEHQDRSHERSSNNEVPVPPTLPRQLEKVILNSTSASVLGTVDDNSVLPAPNHAVLQHLTASAIKSGVIATGCTVRYRRKYITTVYYRATS